jgi:hypothetical protein
MKTLEHRRKCMHCSELFLPDPRNRRRQQFCSKPACQKARKRRSRQAWLAKAENRNYFRDEHNAQRVRDWQKAHPDYWKNTTRYRRRTLQDACPKQPPATQPLGGSSVSRTLQDLCSMQAPLLLGLISMLVDSTLPDDIANSTRRLVAKGCTILGTVPGMNLETTHEKTCSQSGTTPENSSSLQLD